MNALAHELRKVGLRVEQQKPIVINYDGVIVGDYVADLIVEGTVLQELKARKAFRRNSRSTMPQLSESN